MTTLGLVKQMSFAISSDFDMHWQRQRYLGNNIRIFFQCGPSFNIYMKNFVEFEAIVTHLCSVLYLLNIVTQPLTS